MKKQKLKIKRLGNGRFAWSAMLDEARQGCWFDVPHREMHATRVALTRYKAANPRFDYTTKQTQDGLRVDIARGA